MFITFEHMYCTLMLFFTSVILTPEMLDFCTVNLKMVEWWSIWFEMKGYISVTSFETSSTVHYNNIIWTILKNLKIL